MSAIGQASIDVDDSTKLAQNAQETADSANTGVNNITVDNVLTPSEKRALKQKIMSITGNYKISRQMLLDNQISTADMDVAYNNLMAYVNPLLNDLGSNSTVDTPTLNNLLKLAEDAINAASNAFNKMIDDATAAAKAAGQQALLAGQQAQAASDQAKKDAAAAIQLANDNFTKAQTSIDGLTNDVAKASQDTQVANTQALNAYSSASDALNKVVVLTSTVTKLGTDTTAQFNTLTNGLQSKVSQTDFDNLKTGGVNLLQSTGHLTTTFAPWHAMDWNASNGSVSLDLHVFYENGAEPLIKMYSNGTVFSVGSNRVKVKPNTTYLFQIKGFNNGNVKLPNFYFLSRPASNTTSDYVNVHGMQPNSPFGPSGIVQKWFTFTTTADDDNGYIRIDNNGTTDGKTGSFWFIEAKLAEGNVLSDWSQAPEEFASQSSITQLSNLIDQKVSNDTYQSDKIQTANQIASKVNSSDYSSFVSQTNNAITTKVSQTDFDNLTIGGTNLVKNSKFDDDWSGWRAWGASDGATVSFIDNPTNSDWDSRVKRILKIVKPNANGQFGIAQDNVPVMPNTTYTLRLRSSQGKPVCLQHGNGGTDPWSSITIGGEYPTYTFTTGNTTTTNIYIGFDGLNTGTIWVSLVKLEKGTRATDWSISPFDTATTTEFTQLSNALLLKANSADVTSQITVATNGIQQNVSSQVSGLQTQINQTSDTVQILSTTAGTKNLVYNSQFKISGNFPEGWNPNGSGYFSTHENSAYQGVGSIAVNTTSTDWILFGQSKLMPLAVDNNNDPGKNIYSASAMVLGYKDGDKPNGRVHVVLAFFDTNRNRIESDIKGVWSPTADNSWHLVKVEGLAPVANAQYVALQFYTYQNATHAVVNQPMINVGPTVAPYRPDMVSQADITTSINNIHLGVQNSNGTGSMFNMTDNTVLLDTTKIILNGQTSIQNGTIGTAQIADAAINNAKIANASIDNAKITSIDAAKITTGIINTGRLDANSIIANVVNGKTITGNVINGATINADKDGSITTSFGQVTQPASYYNPWSWDSGSISIGGGYVALKATGSAPTDGTKYGNYFLGTLSPSYLKFSEYTSPTSGTETSRIYIDALGITYRDTAGNPDVISIGGSHGSWFKTGAMFGANSYDYRGNIVIGATPHVINSQDGDSIVFEKGIGNKNDTITIIAANLAASSQLSKKKNISNLTPQQGYDWVKQTGISSYLYNTEQESHNYHISPIIDDINEQKQYGLAKSILTNDGAGIDINSSVFVGWLAIQQLQQLNENLQVRVRDLEMKLEGKNES